MSGNEGKISRGLRVNSAVFANPSHPHPGPVRRNHSYHVPPHHGEIRPSEDLLQTALRRGMSRGNSSSRIDNLGGGPKSKNIPMVAAPAISRLGELKWGTYSLDQPVNDSHIQKEEKVPDSEIKAPQKASISPLTRMHEPKTSTTDRRYDSVEAISGRSSRNGSYANIRTNSRASLKDMGASERPLQNLDKRSERGSTFSIAPVGRSDSEVTFSGDDRTSKKSSRSKLAPHSDDDELRYEENFEDAYLQVPGLANATSILDFLKSVEGEEDQKKAELQNLPDFSIKSRSHSVSAKVGLDNPVSRPVTRTHQKMLDLKTLLPHENAEESNMGSGSSKSQDYAVKIQHESIVSQWTQIRLRFSSRPGVKQQKQSSSCRAGILGSIQRQQEREMSCLPKKSDGESFAEHFSVTKDNVDSFLREMWNNASYEMSEGNWSDSIVSLGPHSPQNISEVDDSRNWTYSPDMQAMARTALTSRI